MASYQKRANNKWSVRFLWINEEGKEKYKRLSGYPTKKQAERAYFTFLTENPQNKLKTNTEQVLTLEKLVLHFNVWKKQRVKGSTFYEIEQIQSNWILPYFENKQAEKITKFDILNWQAEINKHNYSYDYKSKLRANLFRIFAYAEKYHNIENVVAKVDGFVKPKTKKEMEIWTIAEFKKFIEATTEPHTSFFMCLYYLGLRLGECLALSPNDFDFKTNMVNINKSLTEKTKNAPFEITPPKNLQSYRKIEMPKVLAKHMKKYFKENSQNKFVFKGARPFATTTLRRRYADFINKAEVKKIRFHDFRHSHASLLIDLGANIVLVAKRLGHKDIKITLNTYSHLMPSAENEIITKLNNLQ